MTASPVCAATQPLTYVLHVAELQDSIRKQVEECLAMPRPSWKGATEQSPEVRAASVDSRFPAAFMQSASSLIEALMLLSLLQDDIRGCRGYQQNRPGSFRGCMIVHVATA